MERIGRYSYCRVMGIGLADQPQDGVLAVIDEHNVNTLDSNHCGFMASAP